MSMYSDGIIFKFRFQKSRFIEEIGKVPGYFFACVYFRIYVRKNSSLCSSPFFFYLPSRMLSVVSVTFKQWMNILNWILCHNGVRSRVTTKITTF